MFEPHSLRVWGAVPIEIAKNLALYVPGVPALARLRHHTGLMDDEKRVNDVFGYLSSRVEVKDKDVLDLGPGQTLRLLGVALEAGASSAKAVDVVEYVSKDEARRRGIELVIYDGLQVPLPTASVDVIWSWDCLEHVRFPETTVAECARLLRSGGHLICEVDIRDHRTTDHQRLPDNLVYPEWLWNVMMWRRSAYTNRVRASNWKRLFAEKGLIEVDFEPFQSATLKKIYPSDPRARGLSLDDFATTGFRAILKRR